VSRIEDLLSARVAVLGGGVTGKAIIAFLSRHEAAFDLFDEKEDGALRPDLEIKAERYGLAVVSPGWRRDHPLVEAFKKAGVRIISEIDLAWLYKEEIAPDQKWVALTGTNGKTTTIKMVESIFAGAGKRAIACGNVGEPVLAALMEEVPYEILALELSSFQIAWSHLPHFEASAILNIAEDHIDWHGSFDDYANEKMRLLTLSESAILNADDVEVGRRSTAFTGRKIFYSLETPAVGELGLVEELLIDRAFGSDPSSAEVIAELVDITPQVPHNVSNALAAAGIALALGISHADIKSGLSSFQLDHHRLELVHESEGVKWVNDSKATNPHAAIAGILSNTSVVWIAGGLAKGASMTSLVKRAAPRLKAAILIGADRELVAEALATYAPKVPIVRVDLIGNAADLMRDVVREAKDFAEPGDVVLLAPACASMDQFNSYAHRGELFTQAVREINE
jgi:UDP-N-acetylmuramoylalanine--D-glutamate ligase